MVNPKQTPNLVPAKNGEAIGLADQKNKKFYTLNAMFLNVWLLCDGERNIDNIVKEFMKVLKKSEVEKIKESDLKKDMETIIARLKKFGLLQ